MNIPVIGSHIKVEVKNFSAMLLNPIFEGLVPKTVTFEGKVIPNSKWDDVDSFCMSTSRPEFPVRNIAIHNVVAIDGVASAFKVKPAVKVVQVTGSKGDVYTVTIDGDNATCTCSGYSFRKTCSHIKTVKEST